MTEGIWAAIIGVGGTILGTLLGFFLGKIDFGKFKVKIKKDREIPYYNCGTLDEFHQIIIINLYNGANKNRVFREAKIVLKDISDVEIVVLPLQDATVKNINVIEDLNAINILPQTGLDIRAKYVINGDNIDLAYKAKKVVLQYQNEKFKKKSIELWECDYKSIAKPHKEELSN